MFQKLLINFTWWVNRKDSTDNNLFAGGFLGLDNIGVFDRSKPLPTGGHLEQADGTAWMAFYCSTMLSMALELASDDPAYEDSPRKFFEHFVAIADAMNTLGGTGLWDEEDGFYYDRLHVNGHAHAAARSVARGPRAALRVRDPRRRGDRAAAWFHRAHGVVSAQSPGARPAHRLHDDRRWRGRRGSTVCSRFRRASVSRGSLQYLLDETEFLSPFGIRSVSRIHHDNPYVFRHAGEEYRVDVRSGGEHQRVVRRQLELARPDLVSDQLSAHRVARTLPPLLRRLAHRRMSARLGAADASRAGRAASWPRDSPRFSSRVKAATARVTARDPRYATDPHWRDLVLFHEYFHGDTGRGVGASHQTGWTSLVVRCLETLASNRTAAEHEQSSGATRPLRRDSYTGLRR